MRPTPKAFRRPTLPTKDQVLQCTIGLQNDEAILILGLLFEAFRFNDFYRFFQISIRVFVERVTKTCVSGLIKATLKFNFRKLQPGRVAEWQTLRI